ncbi:hypothetical protein BD779DRAFT_1476282 [Infundibulicybe gibba]|nr:hypothetical protein BD779DRAFT_1476282 [Infundibulicybe gibba]
MAPGEPITPDGLTPLFNNLTVNSNSQSAQSFLPTGYICAHCRTYNPIPLFAHLVPPIPSPPPSGAPSASTERPVIARNAAETMPAPVTPRMPATPLRAPKKTRWYVVFKGTETGVFDNWPQVRGFTERISGAVHQSYPTRAAADTAFADAKEAGQVEVLPA